jgi:hypothetical protein
MAAKAGIISTITSLIKKLHQKTGDVSYATRMGSTNVKIVLGSHSIAHDVAGVNIVAMLSPGSVNGMVNSFEQSCLAHVGLVLRLYSKGIGSEGLWPQLICCVSFPSIAQYFRKLYISYPKIRMAIVAYLKVRMTIV